MRKATAAGEMIRRTKMSRQTDHQKGSAGETRDRERESRRAAYLSIFRTALSEQFVGAGKGAEYRLEAVD